jgi:electron transport complex protein RnfC
VGLVFKARSVSHSVAIPHRKGISGHAPIQEAGIPAELTLFLLQHIGTPSKPVVKVGDQVKRGQLIAEADGYISANLHAPTSGKVKAIEPRYQPVLAQMADAIIIETDGLNEVYEGVAPVSSDLDSLTRDMIRETARNAGLVGLGGAAFPTAVKISPPEDKEIDTYLLNGAECEPYLTSDQKLMEESAEDIVFGFRALMKGAGVKKGIVCIEDNKPDAIKVMESAISPFPELDLAIVPSRYSMGNERQQIQVVLGREIPPGGLPMDIGVINSNVGTAYALAVALKTGLPLVERIVAITGEGVAKGANLRALIGTPASFLIEKAGGVSGKVAKVVFGGAMMGVTVRDMDAPTLKGTSGVLVFSEEDVKVDPVSPCLRCGRCVEICPLRLMPVWMAAYAENGYLDEAEKFRVMDCCECGACTYVCPSKRPLVQSIRLAKANIRARRQAAANK